VSGAADGNTAFMIHAVALIAQTYIGQRTEREHGHAAAPVARLQRKRPSMGLGEYEVPMLAFTERARRAFSEKRRRPESPARFPSNSSCRALEQSMCLCNHRQ
jgi:hypothetical protein